VQIAAVALNGVVDLPRITVLDTLGLIAILPWRDEQERLRLGGSQA
jgi:hypothetical protein